MKELTPARIVQELDKYIVGQEQAKKSVAIAIRNRWRRQQLPSEMRDDVAPKNIIMIGPTGVGKTEIARRLANLVHAPFLKVEATKYTEIGYHGRDVESIVRDLVELSVGIVKQEHAKSVEKKVQKIVEEKILNLLVSSPQNDSRENENDDANTTDMSQEIADHVIKEIRDHVAHAIGSDAAQAIGSDAAQTIGNSRTSQWEKMKEKLSAGKIEKRIVNLKVADRNMPMVEIFSNAGIEHMGLDFQNIFEKLNPNRSRFKKATVAEAREILTLQESEKLIDREKVNQEGLKRAEEMGIIFIDEIDKIVGSEYKYGPDVSREGVQRDLLPIVEGCSVMTRYGMVRSDHILFIAAGAFSVTKPSDLLPELQGRFPIRVELKPLTKEDLVLILREPKNALIKQYQALLKTEGVKIFFTDDAIEKIASICAEVNQRTQNIGARRLHTIMEKLLEDISFTASEMKQTKVNVDAEMVGKKLNDIVKQEDLARYIL